MSTPRSSPNVGGANSVTGQSAQRASASPAPNSSTSLSGLKTKKDRKSTMEIRVQPGPFEVVTISDSDDDEMDFSSPAKAVIKSTKNRDSNSPMMAKPSEETPGTSQKLNKLCAEPPKYPCFDNLISGNSSATSHADDKEKSVSAVMSPVSQESLKIEEEDVHMAEVELLKPDQGMKADLVAPSVTADRSDVTVVTSGIRKTSISDIGEKVLESAEGGLPKISENEKVSLNSAAQNPSKVALVEQPKPSRSNNEEPKPSTSRGSDDEGQSNDQSQNEEEEEDEDDEEDQENEEDAEGEEEDSDEVEPQDEDGIPLTNIAKLTPDELKMLAGLKKRLHEFEQRLDNLDTSEALMDMDEKTQKKTLKLREIWKKSSAETLEAICKLCKVYEEDYDKVEINFTFKGSGNRCLDKYISVWIRQMIRPEFGGTLDPETIKYPKDAPLGQFSDLTMTTLKKMIAFVAQKDFKTKNLLHRGTNRPIRGDDVYPMIKEDLQNFHAKIFNLTVVPQYTLGKTEGGRSMYNPKLPQDPELNRKLKLNKEIGKTAAADYAQTFEDEARKKGLKVERNGPNDRGPTPSRSDDESDETDYTDEESGQENDTEMKDDSLPTDNELSSIQGPSPSSILGSAVTTVSRVSPLLTVSGTCKSPEQTVPVVSDGTKRKNPSSLHDPEGPLIKKKDGEMVECKNEGKRPSETSFELGEEKKTEQCFKENGSEEADAQEKPTSGADIMPVDADEFAALETDDDDDDDDEDDDMEAFEAFMLGDQD